jgi:hypothetical protein
MLDAAAAGMKTSRLDQGRSMGQLRADASWPRGPVANVGSAGWPPDGVMPPRAQGRRPRIQVTLPFSTLIGIDDHRELVGYGPIRPTWRGGSPPRDLAALLGSATGHVLDTAPPGTPRRRTAGRDRARGRSACFDVHHAGAPGPIDHTISYPHRADCDQSRPPASPITT